MKKVAHQGKRLAVILGIGATLVGLILAAKHFYIDRPVGEGPAGPDVPQQLFTSVWTDRNVLLLGLGDSVTAGYGASPGHSYFDRLVANPPDEWADVKGRCLASVLPNLATKNLAVSGTTSLQHAHDELSQLAESYPDTMGIVVMTSGGNDLIHDYGRSPPREGAMFGATLEQARPWIDAFEKRLGSMLDRIHATFPAGCHIFIANIYDPTDGVGDSTMAGLPPWPDGLAIHKAYNDIIARCAADRSFVHLVDMHAAFLGHGIHCTQFWREHYQPSDPHYWYYENLEDPNDRGYDAIRRLFLLKIAEVLNPQRP
jgi:lysophospholipase L1-like esterase